MSDLVRITEEGTIATLWLNRPERMNAMNLAMWQALGDALESLAQKAELRCLVLRGSANAKGQVSFGAGADIGEFTELRANQSQASRYAEVMERAVSALKDFPHPSIAMIQGACMGGGLELALHCDLRLAANDARFGIPINRIGHGLPTTAFAALVQLCGPALALEMLLEGRIYEASEALARGLVTRIHAPAALAAETLATATRIAEGAPLAARYHRALARRLAEGGILSEAERKAPFQLCDSQDYGEGIRAFLAKEKPRFSGR